MGDDVGHYVPPRVSSVQMTYRDVSLPHLSHTIMCQKFTQAGWEIMWIYPEKWLGFVVGAKVTMRRPAQRKP